MIPSIWLEPGNCLDVVSGFARDRLTVDAIVTDPPYHLTATVKRFGARNSAPAQHGRDGAMVRLSKGFMGKQWDGGDIAFRPETWATFAAVLRPGGYLLAFGGTRTWHRLWCAIEDAGFVVQDTLLWLYGSGWPKRKDMLKPAFEPIVVAYKPGGPRTLQVDECRIPTNGEDMGDPNRFSEIAEHPGWNRPGHTLEQKINRQTAALERTASLGRWPANLAHDGSDEVMEAFAAFGERPGQIANVTGNEPSSSINNVYGQFSGRPATTPRGDGGTASRFFYCAKASKHDRAGSKHPTVKPINLLKWLVPLVTPLAGVVLDPFAGTGTTGAAAVETGRHAILIEREPEYIADIRRRIAAATATKTTAA